MRAEESIVIARPVNTVFEYLADFSNIPQWRGAVAESSMKTDGPVGVGTRFETVSQFLGRRSASIQEVTDYEPDAKLAYVGDGGPIGAIKATYLFSAEDGGTRIDFVGEANPGGLFKLLEPLIGPLARRQIRADNARLKRVLES